MIELANSASSEQGNPEFEIKDSLLGDALERNQITKPRRLMTTPAAEHPVSQADEDGIADHAK